MLSRNNWKEQVRQQEPKKQRFTIKKLTIGVASVLIGFTFMGMSASANTQTPSNTPEQSNNTPEQSNDTTSRSVQLANKRSAKIPATDTTTPIAPSTTAPSYDGTKVVDTPFYNNSRGTNSNLIDNQSKTGQYTFYFTAKDASGKEYASSYAAEKGNPTGVVLNSILDKDAGAYDPNSLEFHFYYQNNTDQDQTINYTLRMADYLNPYKAGHPESSLVPDGSRISDVKVTSKQGNTYDISSVTKTLDGVKSRDGDLRYVGDVPVNLTVKANDAINLVIPFVLNTTAKKSNTTIDDHNEFSVRENGQQTGYLVVRSSTYAPLFSKHKIYPLVNVGNNNYTHDYPDNPGAFDLDPSVYLDNDFMDGFWDGRTGVYKASKPTNLNTVYNSYTYTFLLLDNYQKSLTKHGFTVAFSDGKPVPYYMYQLSKTGSKVVDKNGNPVQGETKGHPYFEVVPVILLNQDETYTTKTAPTAWDPSTMVNKVADPTNYRYWDQKTDSAVRKDNTAEQLTAKDFTVTITKDGQAVKPDANGKYDLSKPGIYTVTYSKDFNGTTISNSGQITVTPAEDTTVTYTFYDETDNKKVEGHDVTVTGQPGTDQKVNLITPEGYKLAEGQTLPTSVTMPKTNETFTIHLVHATKDNQKYEVNYVPMDIERPTTDTSVTKTQMPTVKNADTMPDGTITGYKQKTFDAPKGVTTSVDSKTGELTVTVLKDATTGPFLVPVDIGYQDGRGMICYVPVRIHDQTDTNGHTVQFSWTLDSPIVNLHRTTDDNTNIDVNNSRINTINFYYDWDHTSGNGNYRTTIVYKLNADGTKFVNTTDPTDSFDASGFKYEWRKGYAPNTKFGTGTGTVLAKNNGVSNPEAMFRMNYTITDPSVTRKLNLPTNFSTYKNVLFNFWGATPGQPLTFNQNQDISNLSQAQYRKLIDVTDLGANGWNGTNVDPNTPQEAAYTPGTDTTKTFSMAWAPNGKPSTATVADGVKGTVRINFNDGTYLDVPAAINVVKNNADQYIPAYKDTTVAAKSSVDTGSPSFTKDSKPVTDVPSHTYAFNDGTTKMTINDKNSKNPVTVTIDKTSGAITFTAPDDATEYDIPVTVTYKDGSSNTATAKVFVNKSLDPTKVDPTKSEYKEMFKTVTRDIVTTSVSGQQTTEPQVLDFGRTMTIYGNGDPATYGKWEAGKLSADKFTTQGGSAEFASENITPVDGYTSYYKIGNDGQKVNASAVPSASALDKDGNPVDGTTVYVGYATIDTSVQIQVTFVSTLANLHRTTDDNTNIDVNNSRINTIKIDYDWDHTNGNGNYRKTIVYKLNTDGTKFVNTTDPTDSFDASAFKYEWRNGYAPNTKFGTGTGTVLAQNNGVYNTKQTYQMNYTITDPSVARKLNLSTNYSSSMRVYFNFWGATPGQPLTFNQNQDISNLSQAQYRKLIDVTDLGANGWNGTNVDPNTPQEAAYTPGTDTTKTFSMAWAPNGKPSTATVADGVKGTVRINFNDGTYLDVPAAINVVKNNADQYIPAYKDTTVAAKSSVDTGSPSFTKDSKPVTDVPSHTYAFNDGTTKMTINDKNSKNPVTVTIDKTSGAITFTAPDDATEYDIPVTVTYKDGSSNTATAKVFVNKSLDPTKVDPTKSEYKEMFKTVTRDIVTTSVSGQQTTEPQVLDFGRTMTIYGNGDPATYGKWEAGKLSADKFTTQGGSAEFASENITPVDGYTSYYKIGNDGQKVNASAVPSASALDKDGNPVDGTTVYVGYATIDTSVQIQVTFVSTLANLHRTTDDNTNIDVNNSRINTIKIDYDWDHTNGNGNYRKTIVYKLNTDGTKFVNTTDPTDSFDASAFKYEWRNGYAPNTKFGTGTGTVLAQNNGVYNTKQTYQMNYTITDPSVARKLNLSTNYSSSMRVYFNFWGATPGQPLTFNQNQDISNLSQAQYRKLIDVTDLGANGWNGTNVDPNTPQEAAYTPGTDTTKTFSMAWAPNGKPSTATVADGVKGTVRINFNDGTYLDVPAAINVVKNNADQYIPAYKDTTVAAKSSVDTGSPSFTKDSKPVTDVPSHTYAFNDGTTKMTINDKNSKNPVTVTIDKTSGAITFTAPDDATEYDIPVTVTYKDGSSNTATAKVFVNKSLDPTKVDPTKSEYKEMFKTVTRDIVTTSVSGQQTTEPQVLDFGRTMTIYGNGDPATYGKWEAGKLSADKFTTQGGSAEFASENITPVDGYTSYYKIGNDGQKVNASAVPSASALDKDGNPVDGTTVYVGYDKNNTPTPTEDTTVTYTFYDETDKKPVEGHDVTVTGQPGTDQKVNLTTPEGYKLAEGQTLPTSVTMPKANETITINLVHATKDIKPNDPGVNPSDPVYADMFKTVTRTIKVNNPDRMVDTTTQQVNFNRTKTIDEVTDEVISYGNWTLATGSAKDWGQFNVPQLDGFISYVDDNAAKEVAEENVTADTADVTVEVTYKNSGNNGNNTTPGDDGNHNTNPGDNGNHNTNPGNNGNNNGINNGTQNGNGNGINNGTQNGNDNGINNGTQNGNNNGINNGTQNGNNNGINNGTQNGNNNGINNGTQNGNNNGINNGTQNGNNNGINNGTQNGNNNGINNGTQNGNNNGINNGTQNGNNNGINNGTQNGNNNGINNGTQNGNGNGINNGTQNGNGNKTVNTNVTDNGNGDNGQNNKQALPQTGNTKNDAAVAGLGLAVLLAMLGLGGLKKKRN